MCDEEIPQENQRWVLVPSDDDYIDRWSMAGLDCMEIDVGTTKRPTAEMAVGLLFVCLYFNTVVLSLLRPLLLALSVHQLLHTWRV